MLLHYRYACLMSVSCVQYLHSPNTLIEHIHILRDEMAREMILGRRKDFLLSQGGGQFFFTKHKSQWHYTEAFFSTYAYKT